MGYQNIVDAGGIGLALTGMTIVFIALVLVTVFIAGAPRLLPLVNSILPVVERHHEATAAPAPAAADTSMSEEIVAAIGFALHVHRVE